MSFPVAPCDITDLLWIGWQYPTGIASYQRPVDVRIRPDRKSFGICQLVMLKDRSANTIRFYVVWTSLKMKFWVMKTFFRLACGMRGEAT
jgi:hypothetical protein